jgi:hypothetical protein
VIAPTPGSRPSLSFPAFFPIKRPSGLPEGLCVSLLYFFSVVAAGAVVVAVDVTVEVTADCGAAFGASCFWHPAKAKTVASVRTAMIAVIFFMSYSPPFFSFE